MEFVSSQHRKSKFGRPWLIDADVTFPSVFSEEPVRTFVLGFDCLKNLVFTLYKLDPTTSSHSGEVSIAPKT